MLTFESILNNDKKLITMTGICREEFDSIEGGFTEELRKIRNPKKVNSGAPSKLQLKDKLLMTLIYYRHYKNFDFIGVMFNVDGSTVKRWLDSCEDALEAVLEKKFMPLDTSKSKEELREQLNSEAEIYIDGTEQPIRRPQDKIDQKENYSGKKKRHTSKILVLTNKDKKVIGMTPVYVGHSHDFAMFKEEKISELISPESLVYVDTGFEGIDKFIDKTQIKKPKKKPKKRKLNGGEQHGNRVISSKRVKIEHAIGGFKKFKIASDIFRGITKSMEKSFRIAAGLWNLHLHFLSQKPTSQGGEA